MKYTVNIKKILRKNDQLKIFLKKIKEKNFQINKSFKNTPWIHFKDQKFNFYKILIKKEIVGIIVTIKMKINVHLQFFYIHKNHRSEGIGKYVLKKILPKKKFTTVHVPKKLSIKTQKFYIKNNFYLSNLKERSYKVKYWIKRCNKYDKKTFIEKKLLFRNLI